MGGNALYALSPWITSAKKLCDVTFTSIAGVTYGRSSVFVYSIGSSSSSSSSSHSQGEVLKYSLTTQSSSTFYTQNCAPYISSPSTSSSTSTSRLISYGDDGFLYVMCSSEAYYTTTTQSAASSAGGPVQSTSINNNFVFFKYNPAVLTLVQAYYVQLYPHITPLISGVASNVTSVEQVVVVGGYAYASLGSPSWGLVKISLAAQPSARPSTAPSGNPSRLPTPIPSALPSAVPSVPPSAAPSRTPTTISTFIPVNTPQCIPPSVPSAIPPVPIPPGPAPGPGPTPPTPTPGPGLAPSPPAPAAPPSPAPTMAPITQPATLINGTFVPVVQANYQAGGSPYLSLGLNGVIYNNYGSTNYDPSKGKFVTSVRGMYYTPQTVQVGFSYGICGGNRTTYAVSYDDTTSLFLKCKRTQSDYANGVYYQNSVVLSVPSKCSGILSSVTSSPSSITPLLGCPAMSATTGYWINGTCGSSIPKVCNTGYTDNPPFTCERDVYGSPIDDLGIAWANFSLVKDYAALLFVLLAQYILFKKKKNEAEEEEEERRKAAEDAKFEYRGVAHKVIEMVELGKIDATAAASAQSLDSKLPRHSEGEERDEGRKGLADSKGGGGEGGKEVQNNEVDDLKQGLAALAGEVASLRAALAAQAAEHDAVMRRMMGLMLANNAPSPPPLPPPVAAASGAGSPTSRTTWQDEVHIDAWQDVKLRGHSR